MNGHLKLKVSIFDVVEPVLVRSNVTVERLFQDILREFTNELDLHQRYVLLYNGKILPPEVTIGGIGLSTDATLTLSYQEPGQAKWSQSAQNVHTVSPTFMIRLRETQSSTVFEVTTLPALIGRYSQRTGQHVNVDLRELANADTVSRRHAQISQDNETYVITRLENTNPVSVNGNEIVTNGNHPLKHRDILRLGEIELLVEIMRADNNQ